MNEYLLLIQYINQQHFQTFQIIWIQMRIFCILKQRKHEKNVKKIREKKFENPRKVEGVIYYSGTVCLLPVTMWTREELSEDPSLLYS